MTDTENLTSALDFFNTPAYKDDEPKPQEAETASEPEETDQGAEAPKEEETEAEETPEEQPEPAKEAAEEKEPWTKKAYLGEKTKRQAFEEENKQLKLENEKLKQSKEKPDTVEKAEETPEDMPDYIDDPKGYAKWIREQARQEAMQVMTVSRIESSAEAMRESVTDYDETIAEFGEMVTADPELYKKFVSKANPAKFAYDTVKTAKESRRLSDPAEKAKWEEEIRKDERAKAQAELASKPAAAPKPKAPNMPDLLNAASARSGTDTKPRLKSATDFFNS